MDYGLKVSKPGTDVNNTTVDTLQFSSGFALFKTIASGSTSLTIPSAQFSSVGTLRFNHNLDYTPAIMAYWSDDGVEWRACGDQNYMQFNNTTRVICGATSTQIAVDALKISTVGPGYIVPTTPIYIRYFIYVEPIV